MRTMRWPARMSMVAVAAGLSGAAAGQNEWLIDIAYSDPAGVINSLDDTATVTLWAVWDPEQYAFEKAILDMTADDLSHAGEWSDPHRLLQGFESEDGVIEGETVVGITPYQLHFPEAGIFADTSNPIAVWTATWRTGDLTERIVRVNSASSEFSIYLPNGWGGSDGFTEDFVDSLIEGSGVITIVPTSGTVGALLVGGAVVSRGRRRSSNS